MAGQENPFAPSAEELLASAANAEVETVKKRLLIATDNFLPRWDGIARFLSEMIPRLRIHYDITVVAPDFGPYEDTSITLVRLPVSKTFKGGDFSIPKIKYFRLKQLVKNSDIIFCQSIGPIGGIALTLAHRLHKPVVSFIHSLETELVPRALEGSWLPRKLVMNVTRWWMRRLYSRTTLLIVPSQSIVEHLAWEQIHVPTKEVHLGVDTVKFTPSLNKAEAKTALHLAPEDLVIGYHGRIAYEKDLMTLFRAFMRLQHKHENIKLLLVGDGIEALKGMFKTRKGVVMVGMQSKPQDYLQAMDIYVLPSLTETTSLSTLEAMSCGLPVIATQVGFIKDYIKPGFNGLFFPKQQTYYLAAQLEKLLGSVQLREMLGRNARMTVVNDFNWDITAKGIEEALEEARELWVAKMKRHKKSVFDKHAADVAKRHAELNGTDRNA